VVRRTTVESFAASRGEPECCRGVVCVPRNVGGVTLKSVAEATCTCGVHRVVEMGQLRTVFRRGSANKEWQGARRG
jgi:hypothetical protein